MHLVINMLPATAKQMLVTETEGEGTAATPPPLAPRQSLWKTQWKTKEIKYNTFNNTGPHDTAQFKRKPQRTLPTTYKSYLGTTYLRPCVICCPLPSQFPPLRLAHSTQVIRLGPLSCSSPTLLYSYGNGSMPKTKTKRKSMTRIWQRHTSLSTINTCPCSKKTSKPPTYSPPSAATKT